MTLKWYISYFLCIFVRPGHRCGGTLREVPTNHMEFLDAGLGLCSLAIFGYAGHLTFNNLLFVDYQSSRRATDTIGQPRIASVDPGSVQNASCRRLRAIHHHVRSVMLNDGTVGLRGPLPHHAPRNMRAYARTHAHSARPCATHACTRARTRTTPHPTTPHTAPHRTAPHHTTPNHTTPHPTHHTSRQMASVTLRARLSCYSDSRADGALFAADQLEVRYVHHAVAAHLRSAFLPGTPRAARAAPGTLTTAPIVQVFYLFLDMGWTRQSAMRASAGLQVRRSIRSVLRIAVPCNNNNAPILFRVQVVFLYGFWRVGDPFPLLHDPHSGILSIEQAWIGSTPERVIGASPFRPERHCACAFRCEGSRAHICNVETMHQLLCAIAPSTNMCVPRVSAALGSSAF